MRTALRMVISAAMATAAAVACTVTATTPAHAHNWDSLPDEVIVGHILPGLNVKELWNACNLNHRMNVLCANPMLWKKQLPFFTGAQLDSLEALTDNADTTPQQGKVLDRATLRALITEYRNRPMATIAGIGEQPGYSGNGRTATSAKLNSPVGVAIDTAGNVYIADRNSHTIRRVDAATGIITTIAGTGHPGYTANGGAATRATLQSPHGIAVDAAGNVYIADTGNHTIRRIDTHGTITTIAGIGRQPGYDGDGGPATHATLRYPYGVAVDTAGNVYIADKGNNAIRRINTHSTITTIAGNGQDDYTGDGGPATHATLNTPYGVAVDTAGNVYIADTGNNMIRRVDATIGTITTIAGNGNLIFVSSGDCGPATNVTLLSPYGVTVDAVGNVYIAESGSDAIRRVNTTGTITTIAGIDRRGPVGGYYSGDGGPATDATLDFPFGVAVDAAGYIYIADRDNRVIRRFGAGSARPRASLGQFCTIL